MADDPRARAEAMAAEQERAHLARQDVRANGGSLLLQLTHRQALVLLIVVGIIGQAFLGGWALYEAHASRGERVDAGRLAGKEHKELAEALRELMLVNLINPDEAARKRMIPIIFSQLSLARQAELRPYFEEYLGAVDDSGRVHVYPPGRREAPVAPPARRSPRHEIQAQ